MLLVFVFFAISISKAQDTLNVLSLSKDNSSSTWHLFKQQGAVKIYYQYVDCGPLEYVNFKVENTSSQSLTILWQFEFMAGGNAVPSNPVNSNVSLTVAPGSSEFGSCGGPGTYPFRIFLREANQTAFRVDTILLSSLTITN